MKNLFDGKIRKLNDIIHNPNTIEETAEVSELEERQALGRWNHMISAA